MRDFKSLVKSAMPLNRFEDRGWCGHPKLIPIEGVTPLPVRYKPIVFPGELVRWSVPQGFDPYYYSMSLGPRARGLVIETRWTLVDWYDMKEEDFHYCPESVVLWNDGQVTQSHHAALKLTSRPRSQPKNRPRNSRG